jgi:hypothetical protein
MVQALKYSRDVHVMTSSEGRFANIFVDSNPRLDDWKKILRSKV